MTFLVVITAAAAVLAVTRARRRREVLVYAWLMPASTVLQAVIGGITVLTGLLWWTVAIHLLASMTMVWLAVLLYVKVGEPDDGVAERPGAQTAAAADPARRARRWPRCWSPARMVTGAGPHAGDKSLDSAGAAAGGGDHHAGAHALLAADRLPGAAGRAWASACWRSCRAAAVMRRLAVLVVLVLAQGIARHDAVLHRRARRAGGDARRRRGGLHRGHRGAMGVDARADRARAAPELTPRPARTSAVGSCAGLRRRADASPATVRPARVPAAVGRRRRR